jgi:hypothetical protein
MPKTSYPHLLTPREADLRNQLLNEIQSPRNLKSSTLRKKPQLKKQYSPEGAPIKKIQESEKLNINTSQLQSMIKNRPSKEELVTKNIIKTKEKKGKGNPVSR